MTTYNQAVAYNAAIPYNGSAAGQTITVGQAPETDTAQALNHQKRGTIGQVLETDLAQPVTPQERYTIAAAVETDTAQPITVQRRYTIGQASETDAAQSLAEQRRYLIGQASETDTAQVFNRLKRITLGQVQEVDEAGHISRPGFVGVASEVDTAQPIRPQRRYPVSSYKNRVLADTPVGYFRLGETSGTVAANLGSVGTAGTYFSSPGLGAAGVLENDANASVDFNGTTHAVNLPDDNAYSITTTTKLSVEVWARPDTITGYHTLVGKGYYTGTSGFEWVVVQDGSSIGLFSLNSAASAFSSITVSNAFTVGQWTHIVAEFDSSIASNVIGHHTVYINGVKTTQTPVVVGAQPHTLSNATSVVTVGHGFYYFDGRLDEVSLYNYKLTDAQVLTHYQQNRALETDNAQLLTFRSSVQVGQASETDTAQPLAVAKRITVGIATETDTAQAVGRAKRIAVGIATETDTVQPVTLQRRYPIAVALETDTAQPFAHIKRWAIGQALETDEAQPITFSAPLSLGQAQETDTAQTLGRIKRLAIGQVSETDTAQQIALGVVVPFEIGTVALSDSSIGLTLSSTTTGASLSDQSAGLVLTEAP